MGPLLTLSVLVQALSTPSPLGGNLDPSTLCPGPDALHQQQLGGNLRSLSVLVLDALHQQQLGGNPDRALPTPPAAIGWGGPVCPCSSGTLWTTWYLFLCHAILYYATPCHATLYYETFCYNTLCYMALCYATLCSLSQLGVCY